LTSPEETGLLYIHASRVIYFCRPALSRKYNLKKFAAYENQLLSCSKLSFEAPD